MIKDSGASDELGSQANTSLRTGAIVGAYGMRLDLGSTAVRAGRLPLISADHWPRWTVEHVDASGYERPSETTLDDDQATVLQANGVWTTAERAAQRVTLFMPADEPEESIVHPYFAASAAVAAHWRGALAFHAAAVVIDGEAWGIIGDKGAGKSTFVAALNDAGLPVLTDDLIVIEHERALVGPRFVDLRGSAARHFKAAEDIGRVGLRRRHRLPLGPSPDSAPFRGWFTLSWGDAYATTPVAPHERLAALMPALKVRIAPTAPRDLFALTTLPVFDVCRPRTFDGLGRTIDLLVATASAARAD